MLQCSGQKKRGVELIIGTTVSNIIDMRVHCTHTLHPQTSLIVRLLALTICSSISHGVPLYISARQLFEFLLSPLILSKIHLITF